MELAYFLAENVKRLRKNISWSQEELAHQAGIDRSYMGMIENAKSNCTLEMLERIAGALQVEPIRLLENPESFNEYHVGEDKNHSEFLLNEENGGAPYDDKAGKYQNQKSLTLPMVDDEE